MLDSTNMRTHGTIICLRLILKLVMQNGYLSSEMADWFQILWKATDALKNLLLLPKEINILSLAAKMSSARSISVEVI